MNIVRNYINQRFHKLRTPKERYEMAIKIVNDYLKLNYSNDKSIFDKVIAVGTGDDGFQEVLENKGINSSYKDFFKFSLGTEKLDEKDSTISLLIGLSVLEHLRDPSNFLEESMRVLKPGGILLMVVPNFKYNYASFYDDPTHVKPYTSEGIKYLLKLAGFRNVITLPWVKHSRNILWRMGEFSFKLCNFVPFRGDTKLPIPYFLRINTQVMITSCEKI